MTDSLREPLGSKALKHARLSKKSGYSNNLYLYQSDLSRVQLHNLPNMNTISVANGRVEVDCCRKRSFFALRLTGAMQKMSVEIQAKSTLSLINSGFIYLLTRPLNQLPMQPLLPSPLELTLKPKLTRLLNRLLPLSLVLNTHCRFSTDTSTTITPNLHTNRANVVYHVSPVYFLTIDKVMT